MRLLISMLAAMLLLAGIAHADTAIYSGQAASAAGITLGSWGSGFAEESNSKTLGGSVSIKVTTGGWFQGGRIEFKSPVPLASGTPDSKEYLVFAVAPTVQSSFTTRPEGSWASIRTPRRRSPLYPSHQIAALPALSHPGL